LSLAHKKMQMFMKYLYQVICLCVLLLLPVEAAIYVSPSGNDTNTGTIDAPLYSLSKAATLISAGDTIFMRGGTYNYSTTITLSKSGTDSLHRICLWAYPGEHPFLDFTLMGQGDGNRGFFLGGSYWHIKGLEVYRAGDNGIKIEGNHNIIEFCSFNHCWDSGLQIGLAKNSVSNKGDSAAYNLVVNCDSYFNFDQQNGGKNADGFACKLCAGPGNVFRGCRSWDNADDGWDLYQDEYMVLIENCWTWHNGDAKVYGYSGSWSGNGNGFKLGGNSTYGAPHIARNCVAFDNAFVSGGGKAFDQNDNNKHITLYNCTSWGNAKNIALSNDISEGHVVTNCVVFAPATGGKNYSITSNSIVTNCSWTISGITADASDFVSLDSTLAKAPREADGSLPNNGFAKLVAGSDLIDKGVNVGLPFSGAAPDLGAYEFGLTDVKSNVQARASSFSLLQNYPNPFNPSTVIGYELKNSTHVTLRIFNVLGKQVAELVNEEQHAGNHSINFRAENIPSGVYFYQLNTGSYSESKKMTILK
jgi:pectate disaccharide-lyase